MELRNQNIVVELDEASGYVTSIIDPSDPVQMNWVRRGSHWGMLEGFEQDEISNGNHEVSVLLNKKYSDLEAVVEKKTSGKLQAVVERKIYDKYYEETYTVKNISEFDYFMTQDTFGIHFPFQCLQYEDLPRDYVFNNSCTAHVWCGDEVCWLYGVKLTAEQRYLLIYMVEGSSSDYSIHRDITLSRQPVMFRGDIVLNPSRCVIAPCEEKKYCFRYVFTDNHPKDALIAEGVAVASADVYTPSVGETVKCQVACSHPETVRIFLDNHQIKADTSENTASWTYLADTLGEKVFHIHANDKHTLLRILVTESVDTLMERRAHFIATKQQFLRSGSQLDGAYLVYDNAEHQQYCDNYFNDNGAARERIFTGILIARQLQKKHDAMLMQSLEKHRDFVLRELYDRASGTVYNAIGKNNAWHRIYNYPWFSLYFLEWYKLTGDIVYLQDAAKILLAYYQHGGELQDSQCIEAVDLIANLEKEKLFELKRSVYDSFIAHADSILERGLISNSEEINCLVNEIPNSKACYLAQAFILSGEEKYKAAIQEHIRMAEGLFSFQPDFHLNGISVRHWEGFWFGKSKHHGDTFPQYWSSLNGWMYDWCKKAGVISAAEYINSLRNNLCLFSPDGSASCLYLYPYSINIYASHPESSGGTRPVGKHNGKKYDDWSNDQDLALYYNDKLLNG